MNTEPQGSPRKTRPIVITIGSAALAGDLSVPAGAQGLVIVASASGRFSPRSKYLADALDRHLLATLLIDLLTEEEEAADERAGRLKFDIRLLADRLVAIGDRARREPDLRALPVGLLGASTGGSAALWAVAQQPRDFRAIVSFGGRPDLAGSALGRVMVPTLFIIVGERDEQMIDVHERALFRMHNDTRLEIVAGATSQFEEADALAWVAALAAGWFNKHLTDDPAPA
jgi:dienelactone hydrolase